MKPRLFNVVVLLLAFNVPLVLISLVALAYDQFPVRLAEGGEVRAAATGAQDAAQEQDGATARAIALSVGALVAAGITLFVAAIRNAKAAKKMDDQATGEAWLARSLKRRL